MTSAPQHRRKRHVNWYDPDHHSCHFSARRVQRDGYGFGHAGTGVLGTVLIIVVILMLLGRI